MQMNQQDSAPDITSLSSKKNNSYDELMKSIYSVLETYSNVHRGSGYNSMLTTHLYEQAREIVLDYLGLNKRKFTVIFCTPARATALIPMINSSDYKILSSSDFGLSLGVIAVAVKKKSLPKGVPFQTGGGTTRLYSREWVIWDKAPDKFEAGTPAVVNIIAFAKALLQVKHHGKDYYFQSGSENLTVEEILFNDELKEFSGKELLHKLRQTLIGKDLQVPTRRGLQTFINLDNSASTRTFEPIWESFSKALFISPEAKQQLIEKVKSVCAEALGAPLMDFDIIFTSNTTESINFLAQNLQQESDTESVILNTILEHSSNDLPWRNVPGYSVVKLGVDKEGFYDLKELENTLSFYNHENAAGKKRIKLVAVNGASNVLGSCNDLDEISRIVHSYGANLFVDAAQLIAHRPVNMEKSGIDFLAFSGHKIYAPFGCGVLIARKGALNFNAALLDEMRVSGEENIGGIAALGKALNLLSRIGFDVIIVEEKALTEAALKNMLQIEGLKLFGVKDTASLNFQRKIGVIVFEIKGSTPGGTAKKLASGRGIGVRYGCHCAHIIIKYLLNFTPWLEKIQKTVVTLVPVIKLQGLVRVSFGLENTGSDVDKLNKELREIAAKKTSPSENIQLLTTSEYKKKLKEHINNASKNIYG